MYQNRFQTVKNKSDLYSIFTEHAYNILKEGGVCSYIFSNSWMGTDSFSLFRSFLVSRTRIEKLVDLPDKVFENASVRTCIILYTKNFVEEHSIVLSNYDGKSFTDSVAFLKYSDIKKYEHLPFSFEKNINLQQKECIRLGDIADFTLGIKTSNDKKFISNLPFKEDSYRLIRGRNINRYSIPLSEEWIWYRPDLFMEKVGAGPRKLGYFLVPQKIIIQDVAQEICATIDREQHLCNDTLNVIYNIENNFKLEYILAILNSRAVRFWHKKVFPEGLHIKKYQLETIPIPVVSLSIQEKIADKVNCLIEVRKSGYQNEYTEIETEIDRLVYDLYGLTEDEIKIVEGTN